jgi:hypothetical protein
MNTGKRARNIPGASATDLSRRIGAYLCSSVAAKYVSVFMKLPKPVYRREEILKPPKKIWHAAIFPMLL